ncbi:hypothetical protein ACHWUR_29300 [Klebsiella pneumoniae]
MLRWQRLTGLLPRPAADRSPAAGAHARRAKRAPARPAAAVASGGGLGLALAGQPAGVPKRRPRRRPRRKPWPSGGSIAPSCSRELARSATSCSSPPVPAMSCAPAACKDAAAGGRSHLGTRAGAAGAGLEPRPGEIATGDCRQPAAEETVQQPALLRIVPNNQDQLLPALGEPTCANCSLGLTCCCSRWATGSRVVMLVLADLGGQPFSDLHAQAFAKTALVHQARSSSSAASAARNEGHAGTLVGRAFR